jgi:hypothetical protein
VRATAADSLAGLRRLAELLDSRFRIPGTGIRFGLDPLLSVVPGIGDLVSPAFALLLLAQGVRQRAPVVVLVRVLVNGLVDAAIGAVPVVGDIGDIFWRANARNLDLLERHIHPGVRPAPADYAIAWTLAAVFGALAALTAAAAIWWAASAWWWLTA